MRPYQRGNSIATPLASAPWGTAHKREPRTAHSFGWMTPDWLRLLGRRDIIRERQDNGSIANSSYLVKESRILFLGVAARREPGDGAD